MEGREILNGMCRDEILYHGDRCRPYPELESRHAISTCGITVMDSPIRVAEATIYSSQPTTYSAQRTVIKHSYYTILFPQML